MATAKKPTASKPKATESKPETSEPKAETKPKAPKRKAITTPKKVLDGVQRENYVTVEFTIDMPKQKINKGDQYSVGKSTADSLVKLKRAKIL
jgi:hypothetical protein